MSSRSCSTTAERNARAGKSSAALSDGTPLGFRTVRRFGATENSVALGRHVKSDGGDDFVAMVEPTFGRVNALPVVGEQNGRLVGLLDVQDIVGLRFQT